MAFLKKGRTVRLSADAGIDFGIANSIIPIVLWSSTTVNRFQVDGTLTLGGKPVAGAILRANQYTLPAATDATGKLSIRRDQSVLDRTAITVKDATTATIGGVAATSAELDELKTATFTIETAFTVKLDGDKPALKAGAANVTLTGTLTFSDGTPIPPIALWGYTLSGAVLDGKGVTLKDVYVSVSDDEGETWALSNKTGDDGTYELRYYPIEGGATFTVRVPYGGNVAKSDAEATFKVNTSSTLDRVLDVGMGMVTGTGSGGAFDVKVKPGAKYIGYLVGLSDDDKVIDATLTWPETTGKFTFIIPNVNFTGPVGFFQQRSRFFSETEAAPGSDVAASIVPKTLDAGTPRNILPLLSLTA